MQKWTLLPIFIDIERDQAYNTCYYKPYIPHSKVELHYLVDVLKYSTNLSTNKDVSTISCGCVHSKMRLQNRLSLEAV